MGSQTVKQMTLCLITNLIVCSSSTWLEPEILDRFCQGQQSLHHNSGIYNGQWSDMFIETNWMRKGHGPGGITGDLRKMSGDDENVLTTHKEESPSRIRRDGIDRQSPRAALESRIDPMDPVTHLAGCLLNISNGQIAKPDVNVDRALHVGSEQLTQFEASWPEGFHNKLSKQVVTFAEKKKRLSVGENSVVDQEAIYARVIGLLVSQRDLDLQQVLATELAVYPPSMFQADGQMRVVTGKSMLKNNLQVEVSQRLLTCPTAIVVDVSAVLWTVHWPANGTVQRMALCEVVWS